MVNDERGLQVEFMPVIHGVRSFNSLRSRARYTAIAGQPLLLAALSDIIASKRGANRSRDRAVIEVLERTLHEKQSIAEPEPAPKPEKNARRARRRE
jgi:hypothetical protein